MVSSRFIGLNFLSLAKLARMLPMTTECVSPPHVARVAQQPQLHSFAN